MIIKHTFTGPIPEKNYTMIRKDGQIKQSDLSKIFETETKLNLKDINGWTSETDPEHGEHTPLQVNIKIYTPYRPILIKQVKAILDALKNAEIYVDDCSIVDLTAERIPSKEEFAELIIQPADKNNIEMPTGQYVYIDRHIGTLKNNAFDEAGFPLDKEKHEQDKEMQRYIRTQFDQQQEELIDGEFEFEAIYYTKFVGVETAFEDKQKALNMERWTVNRPDIDNCTYKVLVALKHYQYDEPEDLTKLHILKTFSETEQRYSKIWLKNKRSLTA